MRDGTRTAPAGALSPIFDDGDPSDGVEGLFDAATNRSRRAALIALHEEGPLPTAKLAEYVAAGDRPPSAVNQEERREAETALHHSHLPRLADDGLVDLDRRDDGVVVSLDDGLESETVQYVLGLAERERGAAVVDLLDDPDRRHLLSEVQSATDPIALDDLAESLAGRERADPDCDAVSSARIALHHVHLPRMEAAGVVEYDPEGRRVTPAALSESLLERIPDS